MMKREKRQSAKIEGNPQYTFRIPLSRAEQFNRVREMLEYLYEHYKKTQKEDELTINRNDIIIEALEIGMKSLKKDSK